MARIDLFTPGYFIQIKNKNYKLNCQIKLQRNSINRQNESTRTEFCPMNLRTLYFYIKLYRKIIRQNGPYELRISHNVYPRGLQNLSSETLFS